MRQKGRSRSLIECITFSSTRRIWLTLVSVMLIMLSGCATLPDPVIEYKPLIRGDFSSRTQPAKVSKESAASLIKDGYVMIGNVQATVPVEICDGDFSSGSVSFILLRDERCRSVSGALDATAAVLEKAALQGGDAVVLLQDKKEETGVTHKNKRENVSVIYGPYLKTTTWDNVTVSETVVFHQSAGAVWRHDSDHSDVVKALLSGTDVNAKDEDGTTALMIAADHAPAHIVKALLKHGADVNAKDKDGKTALIKAVEGGHAEAVKVLLAHGAEVNGKDSRGKTALMHAEGGEVVTVLLAHGADAKGMYGVPALTKAAGNGDAEVVKALLARGADMNASKNEALMKAAAGGHTPMVKTLLAHHPDVNAKDRYGETVLMKAAQGGHVEIVKALLASGADVNVKSKGGKSALWSASEGGNAEVIKALAARGADVNTVTYKDPIYKVTALMAAAYERHVEAVNALLAHGADVNAKGDYGITALLAATMRVENWDVVKALLAHGADVNATTTYNRTALSWVEIELQVTKSKEEKEKIAEVIDLLKKAGAKK